MSEEIVEPFVVTDLRNGIGNILVEILVGLFLANKLSKLTGKPYRYYALLTHRVMYGHQTVFTEEHQTLPHPLDLKKIYPGIVFIKNVPNGTLNINLDHKINIAEVAFSNGNPSRLNVMVNNLQNLLAELADNAEILPSLRYNPDIVNYVTRKYDPYNALGVHVRLEQVGDYMKQKYPTVAWYKKAVEKVILTKGTEKVKNIFLVSGISSAKQSALHFFVTLVFALKSSFPDVKIHVVDKEPYYVDLVILNLCQNLVITNTTFSLASALMTLDPEKMVVYPDLIDANHFAPIVLPGFELLPTESFVTYSS